MLTGCYEPKEGCLDIDATTYDVSADDPCDDCCEYPVLSLLMQHHVVLATQPDTSFSMKYDSLYPSPFDPSHYFSIDRGRFFISDLKLVRENGEEIGVLDSIWLPLTSGDSIFVEDNFSKHDRDIFQAASVGTVRTSGLFSGVKFTVGLSTAVQQAWVSKIVATHPLAVKNDTLSYEKGFGIIPFNLTFRPDALPGTQPIDFRFTDPKQISLDFAQPIMVERGFNLKLTLRIDYMALFQNVDFLHHSKSIIFENIDSQIANAFSVTALKLE